MLDFLLEVRRFSNFKVCYELSINDVTQIGGSPPPLVRLKCLFYQHYFTEWSNNGYIEALDKGAFINDASKFEDFVTPTATTIA